MILEFIFLWVIFWRHLLLEACMNKHKSKKHSKRKVRALAHFVLSDKVITFLNNFPVKPEVVRFIENQDEIFI